MGQAMFWVTQHCGKDEIWISERNLAPGSQIWLLGAKFRSREPNFAPGSQIWLRGFVVTKVLGIGRGQFSRVCQVVDDNEFVV